MPWFHGSLIFQVREFQTSRVNLINVLRAAFAYVSCARSFFCTYVLGLYLIGITLPAQKLCVERWWNWTQLTVIDPFLSCEPGALCCNGIPLLTSISLDSSLPPPGITWDRRSPKLALLSGGGLSKLTVSSAERKNNYCFSNIPWLYSKDPYLFFRKPQKFIKMTFYFLNCKKRR